MTTQFLVSSIGIEFTTPSELIMIAKELHTTHSMGLDEIDPMIAKSSIDAISTPLAEIINCCIASEVVPESLKIAKVIPIFRNGDKRQLGNNYRPISVLPLFLKFYEKSYIGLATLMSYV